MYTLYAGRFNKKATGILNYHIFRTIRATTYYLLYMKDVYILYQASSDKFINIPDHEQR